MRACSVVATVVLLASPTAFAQALTALPPPAPTPSSEPTSSRPGHVARYGFDVSLFGPNSLVGAGFTSEPLSFLEPGVWLGYAGQTATAVEGADVAHATITEITGLARARFWVLPTHSVVLDANAGVASFSYHATEGSSFDYTRKATPLVVAPGVGYGYRSPRSSLRLSVVIGLVAHAGAWGASRVTSSGLAAGQADALKRDLDKLSDELIAVRPYLEATFGFLF